MELVQKNLLKTFVFESEKKDDDIKKNKFLINQLAKTIAENSKVLAEFGMAPPIIAKIKNMMPLDISSVSNKNENLTFTDNNTICKNDDNEIRIDSSNAKSDIFPPIDNDVHNNHQNKERSTDNYDPNRVF